MIIIKCTFYRILNSTKKYFINNNISKSRVPKITKITINLRINIKNSNDNKYILSLIKFITILVTQKPLLILGSKKSFDFGIKRNNPVSLKVNLMGTNMINFLGKLIEFFLYSGEYYKLLKLQSFGAVNNITLGIPNCNIFSSPFLSFNSRLSFGMDINILMSSYSLYFSYKYLKLLGIKFL